MTSPFPGMDPFLERHWSEIHQGLITYSRDRIQFDLPDDLFATVESRVFLESRDRGDDRSIFPDVFVIERPGPRGNDPVASMQPDGGVAVAEPMVVHVADEPMTQRFIEIRDGAADNRVVTVIEFLSPANKTAGPGRDLYEQKQRECTDAGASLVEIDLVRSGTRCLRIPSTRIPIKARTPYIVCATRPWNPFDFELYPIPLAERLPVIRIPLREKEKDTILDLQALIDQCYRNGRFSARLKYAKDPIPPLDPVDAQWADELLKKAGLRGAGMPTKQAV